MCAVNAEDIENEEKEGQRGRGRRLPLYRQQPAFGSGQFPVKTSLFR